MDYRGWQPFGFCIGEPVQRLIFAIPLLSTPVPDNLFGGELDNVIKASFVALNEHWRF
ncbi:hypothetical protein J122_1697 [Marinobacter excellens LAMA 842]|jgi:hypothetical protein|uniref:Uncharacterized protein n=2 Tax=Marinobacteraceae TaxID=2887365 RepID=A0A137SCR2_9GAMM|nr:hypothetical protein J122_1697 [Marinobacter excellens LAMA 842]|tara:strand:+ start:2011 stop:2184 length:174 start_codon:yes stop_codon:yes gene_type:complete